MRVLVTGAGGFIGSALSAHLTASGMRVTGSSRGGGSGIRLSPDNESFDPEVFTAFDVVVHCAARVHQMHDAGQNEAAFIRDNVHFTTRVAEACQKAGVRHFVFFSSIKVLGESTGDTPFSSQSAPNPQDAYGRSKWQAEEALKALVKKGGMSLSIVRIPLVYGSGAKGNLAALDRLAAKGIPLPFGGIKNRRSLLGLSNLCGFVERIINDERARGATFTYLLADPRPVSTPDVYRYLGRQHGKSLKLPRLPGFFWSGLHKIPRLQPVVERLTGNLEIDISDALNLTGWNPVHESLRE